MKRILIFLFIISFGINYTNYAQALSKSILPNKARTGLTKKGETYNYQNLNSNAKSFFVGYDPSTQTYGRGYLEFDLSSIPSNAIINYAELIFNTKFSEIGETFGRDVKLYLTSNLNENSSYSWGNLSVDPLFIMTMDLKGGGLASSQRHEDLDYLVGDSFGGKIYFALVHKNESSNIVRFDGSLDQDIRLDIYYSLPGNLTISGPSSITDNKEVAYTANFTGGTAPSTYNWTVEGGKLTIVSGQGTRNVVIKSNSGAGSGRLKVNAGGFSTYKDVSITSNTEYVTNQTITTSKNYNNQFIEISNTTISNNAIVNFIASEKITISPSFRANLGTKVVFRATGAALRSEFESEFSLSQYSTSNIQDVIPNQIYPNIYVSNNLVSVEMGLDLDYIERLDVYNIYGAMIYTKKPSNSFEYFDMTHSVNGVYILRVVYKDKNVKTVKFILNK